MRRLLFLCGFLAIAMFSIAQQTKKVAILEVVDREGKLSYSQKLMLRSNLARAVTNTEGFEAFDRTDIDAIMEEQNFQRTGLVSEAQIRKLGEMTGAAYILVAEGTMTDDNKIFVTAKVLNVESTKLEITDNYLMGVSSNEMQRGCRALASKMFGALAGASTSTNKFMNLFKKQQSSTQQVEDSIAAAKKAEQAAAAAAAKEQQRLEAERIREERAAAEQKAREEKAAAEERARQEKAAAEQRAREEKAAAEERARQEKAAAEERARQDRLAAEEKARQERAIAEAAALERKRLEEERKAAEAAERAKYSIAKVSNNEYRLGNSTMDKKAYENFIYQNCPEAWQKHLLAKRVIISGWTCLGVGVVLCSAWGMLPLAEYYYGDNDNTYYITSQTREDWYLTGIVSGSIGAALAFTSIPLLAAGYSIKNNTYKTYNKSCTTASKSYLSLNLQASQNGLGLALQF